MAKKQNAKPAVQANEPKVENTTTTIPSNPSAISRWIYPIITLIFLAIVWLARTNLFSLPFERDEGSYSYMGQLLLEGGRPYIDFYEMKLPGLFYGYAAMVAIFGKSVEGMHLGFGLLSFLSAFIVWLIVKELFNQTAAMAATVSFAILSLTKLNSGFAAQGEHLVVFFAALGTYLTIKGIREDKFWQYLIAGGCLAMAVLVKQTGVFFAIGAGSMMVLANIQPFNLLKIVKNTGLMLAGFLGILGVFALLMVKNGSLQQMNYFVFDLAKTYTQSIAWETPPSDDIDGKTLLTGAIENLTEIYTPYFFIAFLGIILTWFINLEWYKKIGITIFAIMSFLSVTPGLRFYGHYFLQFMLGFALLIGAAVYAIGNIFEEKIKLSFGNGIAAALFVLLTIVVINNQKDYYFSPNIFKTIREVYGDNPFGEAKLIADYIKANSRYNSPIAVFGSEPQIYFETGRKAVSRHNFLAFTSPLDDVAKGWRGEFKADVEKAKPEYIISVVHQFSWLFPPNSDKDLLKWSFDYAQKNQYALEGIADLLSGSKPTMIWGAAAQTYVPKAQNSVYIFRKK